MIVKKLHKNKKAVNIYVQSLIVFLIAANFKDKGIKTRGKYVKFSKEMKRFETQKAAH